MHRILPALLIVVGLAACAGVSAPGLTVTMEPYDDAAPAARGTALPDVDIPFEKAVLPNGLTLIVHEDRKAPVVAVNVWYHVGSKDERPGKTGFAHLFEHLMFQGSENHRDEFFRPLEKLGATDLNGTTSNDRTNYFQTVPTPALDVALWLESDRMGHLLGAIDQKLLDEQRGVVQNERRQNYDNQPYGRVVEVVSRAVYPPGHPYHWIPIGSLEDLNAASLADVKQWFRDYYGAANVTLVLAGDIDMATAREKVMKHFGHIPAGPPVERRTAWTAERTESRREEMQDRVAQVRLYKVWNVPRLGTPDEDLLELAAHTIGGGAASRFDERLLHKDKIVDGVSASLWARELAGLFFITADVKQGVEPARVEAALDEELKRFLTDGPSAAELARAKTDIVAGFIRGVERVGGFGGKSDILAFHEVFLGDAGAWRDSLARVKAATREQVRDAARRWLARGDYTLTVRPYPAHTTAPAAIDRSRGLPQVKEFPELRFPALQRARLKSGIPVVLAERHEIPVVQVQLQFDAGFAADPPDRPGLSSFATGMLDEGTRSLPALELKRRIEDLGAVISAGSGLDTTQVYLSALKTRLEESLALYADVARNPAYDPAEVERVRGQWLAGIAREKTQPSSLARRLLPPLLYGPGHAYAMPLTGSGTEASIRALKAEDLHAFHRRWLRPDNATILVAGDTTLAEIVPLLEGAFAGWKAPDEARPAKNIAPVPLPPAARVFLLDKPGAAQSVIIAGQVAPPTAADNNTEILTMNEVIGGAFTSRLNMNLREDKHWAYGIRSSRLDARGPAPYLVSVSVQTDKTAESAREILRELRDFVGKRPATVAEIGKVKDNDIRSLPGSYETANAVLGGMSYIVQYGKPDDYIATSKARIEKQTLDGIRAAAREVLRPEQLTWLIVGDLAKIEAPVRKLGLGPVKVLDLDGRELR